MKLRYSLNKVPYMIALCITLFMGCIKTDDLLEPIKPPIETPPTANDALKVAATVTGSVIDENNQPVANALVTAGTATTNTDAMGNFSFRNIVISVLNGSVTVSKTGYFKGIRNFVTEEGKNNFVKIQLIKQTHTGTIAAASGGVVTTNNATITFPANAFVTVSGAPYTGNVKVYAAWIDPTAPNLPLVVPGDLRGLNSSNGEYLLKSYGMVGAELKDDNGNPLKIATGKTASISFPIPTSLQGTAPETIPLWHFDEATNRWREEGTATKNGNTYVGQVNKFSFWNVDVPANFVNLEMRLLNSANSFPLANTLVKVTSLATNTSAYDFTNDSGYVSGFVPKNENLKFDIIAGSACYTTAIYTQNIGSLTSHTSLGDISINVPTNQVFNFSGIVKDCNNLPVSNGYVSLYLANGTSTIAYTNASGAVNFSLVHCGGTTAYSYNAVDLSNGNYSNIITGTATNNTINLGNIAACGNTINLNGVYIAGSIDDRAVYWKNGVPIFLTSTPSGNKSAYASRVLVYNNDAYVLGNEEDSTISGGQVATIKLWKNGVVSNITSGLTQAFGYELDIYNGDVYILGSENNGVGGLINKVWVNGVATALPQGSFDNTNITDIKVNNGDVYVSGTGTTYTGGTAIRTAIYWKNGALNILTGVSQKCYGNDVFISGTDIYIAGADSVSSVYWKNGIKTVLPIQSPYISASANSVFVNNTDVYIAGSQSYFNPLNYTNYSNATYWKNNTINRLTNYSDLQFGYFLDVFVKNNIVYTVGQMQVPTFSVSRPIYFQDNVQVPLTGFTNFQDVSVNSIFVQ